MQKSPCHSRRPIGLDGQEKKIVLTKADIEIKVMRVMDFQTNKSLCRIARPVGLVGYANEGHDHYSKLTSSSLGQGAKEAVTSAMMITK